MKQVTAKETFGKRTNYVALSDQIFYIGKYLTAFEEPNISAIS